MATKPELEAELAALKKLFAESRETRPDAPEAEPDETSAPEPEAPGATSEAVMSEALAALKGSDLEDVARQIMKELESLPEKKPLLTALGAFVLGYLIGRAR